MSAKKELVAELKGKLINMGFYEDYSDPFATKFMFDKDFMNTISVAVPESQIQCMIEMIEQHSFSTAAGLYNAFKAAGLLHVEPIIMEDKKGKVPSLMLGWKKYLHWFRGYHFQISGTHSGIGSFYSGADRLDFALNATRNVRYGMDDAAGKFIFVGCLIPVLCYLEQGTRLLNAPNSILLNEFVKMSGELDNLDNTCMDDFMKYVSVKEYSTQPSYPAEVYGAIDGDIAVRILDESLGYGLLTIGRNTITFTAHPKDIQFRTRKIAIPDWFFGTDEDGCSNVYNHKIIYNIMIRALMTMSGFRADYMCMYPIGTKRGDIKRLDYNLPYTASTWGEIERYIDKAVKRYFPDEMAD